MANTNPITQVLVTSGNQHPIAAGQPVTALKNGQIGVFNAHTGLAVDVTKAGDLKDVFIAVGVNRTLGGTNTAEDIFTSAGQKIIAAEAKGYTFKGYVAGQNQIKKIAGFSVDADGAENVVKIELKNQAILREGPFVVSFVSMKTSVADVVADLVAQINAHPDKLMVATATDANASITIEFKPFDLKAWNGAINHNYIGLNGTEGKISIPAGLTGAAVTTTQELRFAEGRGYDLKQEEYIAGGWNGKPGPYRQSDTIGGARPGFEYMVNENGTYNVINLTYEGPKFAAGGWEGTKVTTIVIPCADTLTLVGDAGVTSNGIIDILDKVFTQFKPMLDDATANGDCTNTTTNLLTPDTDGVEIVS